MFVSSFVLFLLSLFFDCLHSFVVIDSSWFSLCVCVCDCVVEQ